MELANNVYKSMLTLKVEFDCFNADIKRHSFAIISMGHILNLHEGSLTLLAKGRFKIMYAILARDG